MESSRDSVTAWLDLNARNINILYGETLLFYKCELNIFTSEHNESISDCYRIIILLPFVHNRQIRKIKPHITSNIHLDRTKNSISNLQIHGVVLKLHVFIPQSFSRIQRQPKHTNGSYFRLPFTHTIRTRFRLSEILYITINNRNHDRSRPLRLIYRRSKGGSNISRHSMKAAASYTFKGWRSH